jgi:hypothetical protein
MRALAVGGGRGPLAHARGSVSLARGWVGIVLCSVACSLITGCGSIGEPLYPALHIPSRVTDLAVVEQGANLAIAFTIPALTTEGLPVKDIGLIDLRVGPGPSNGWNVDQWANTATSVQVPAPEKPGPLEATVPAAKFIGTDVVVAVRVTNSKGKDAGWSDYKTFTVQPPLPDPTNFHVAADPKGVALTWAAPGENQFRIFRQLIREGTSQNSNAGPQLTPVLLATASEPSYIDISAEFGNTYSYSIQAVRNTIESNVVGPESITRPDIFPPAVPTGLTLSAGIGSVELAWNRNTETEFKEYRVLRSEEGSPFAELARGLDAPVYSDHNVQSGKRYRYEVLAVGQNGHASEPCAPVEIAAP